MMRVAVGILPEVRQLLREDPAQLSELLEEIHDEDLADLVELLDDPDAAQLLTSLRVEDAAPIFERLDDDKQEDLIEELGFEKAAPIVGEMSADDRTDLIEGLPEDVGEKLFESLERHDPEAAAEVEELAQWAEDSAGGLMTTDYVSVDPDLTVSDIIEKIRVEGTEAETVYYVYVINEKERLLGVCSLRDILLAGPTDLARDVMTENVHAVSPTTDQEEVARTMAKYDFSALPVVGPSRKLLGVITVDDVMDVLTQEQTEDVQRLGGVEPMAEGYFDTGFWTLIKKRLFWLCVLFVGEFATGTALRAYDDVLHAVATLSYYVPLLISTGGNSGSQSASLIIRGLAVGEITSADYKKIFVRELGQGLVMGLALAAIGGTRAALWGDGIGFVFTIGVTLIFIVMMGCVVGSMLPLGLRKVGLDPATSSAPFIASLVDVLGIVLYFSVAKVVLASVIEASIGAGATPAAH